MVDKQRNPEIYRTLTAAQRNHGYAVTRKENFYLYAFKEI